jgi:ABC-type transporter Mla subunit MlaD
MTSIIVEAFDDAVKFFDSIAAHAPEGDTTIAAASNSAATAGTAIKAAIPAVAEAAANAVLAFIPGGSVFAPEADEILTLVIQKLEGQKSTAPPAS